MSFLNIFAPVGTLTSLVEDICKQIEAGRLEVSDAPSQKKPTSELKQLIAILEQKLSRNFKSHSLIKMDSLEDYYLDEVEGEKCIFCLKRSHSGPAIWTDMVRECRVEHNNVLLVEEGYLHAEGSNGGIYLILWPLSKEPEESTLLREALGRRDNITQMVPRARHIASERAMDVDEARGVITQEERRKQLTLGEKLDREIKGWKRVWDLMARLEQEDAIESPTGVSDMREETTHEETAGLERLVKFLSHGTRKSIDLASRGSIDGVTGNGGTQENGTRLEDNAETLPTDSQRKKKRKIL